MSRPPLAAEKPWNARLDPRARDHARGVSRHDRTFPRPRLTPGGAALTASSGLVRRSHLAAGQASADANYRRKWRRRLGIWPGQCPDALDNAAGASSTLIPCAICDRDLSYLRSAVVVGGNYDLWGYVVSQSRGAGDPRKQRHHFHRKFRIAVVLVGRFMAQGLHDGLQGAGEGVLQLRRSPAGPQLDPLLQFALMVALTVTVVPPHETGLTATRSPARCRAPGTMKPPESAFGLKSMLWEMLDRYASPTLSIAPLSTTVVEIKRRRKCPLPIARYSRSDW